MSKGDDSGGGLMSSAGLVRYFESEDRNAIKIDPKSLVAWALLFGVLVQVLNAVGLGTQGAGNYAMLAVLAAFFGLTVGMVIKAATEGEV